MIENPRVVHVTECFGGVETYLSLLVSHFPEADSRFAFVLSSEGDFADDLRSRGVVVVVVPMPRTRLRIGELVSALRVRQALKRLNPSIVHLHSSQAGLIGRLASIGMRWRTVYTPHAFYFLGKDGVARWGFRTVERLLNLVFGGRILGTSASESDRAVDDVGIPADRVHHLTNAADVIRLGRLGDDRNTSPGRVVLVGRISVQKNIEMFLQVIQRLKQHSELSFYIVGVGHYPSDEALLHQMLEAAGLVPEDLTVVPWMARSELLQWLADAAVVVLTSRYESFGYTLAEASALGVPVIGTDVDGIRDVVEQGVNGILVPLDGVTEMSDAILELTRDSRTWEAFSRRGSELAKDRFDIDSYCAQLSAYYDTVAAGE